MSRSKPVLFLRGIEGRKSHFLLIFCVFFAFLLLEQRFDNPKLERGICEVIQDQMERFLDFYGNKFSNEYGMSFSNDLCPRTMKSPYFEQWQKGMKEQVQFALAQNSREREPLAQKLESWGNRWIRQVAQDVETLPVEYVGIEDLNDRLVEHNNLKQGKNDEL